MEPNRLLNTEKSTICEHITFKNYDNHLKFHNTVQAKIKFTTVVLSLSLSFCHDISFSDHGDFSDLPGHIAGLACIRMSFSKILKTF